MDGMARRGDRGPWPIRPPYYNAVLLGSANRPIKRNNIFPFSGIPLLVSGQKRTDANKESSATLQLQPIDNSLALIHSTVI